jgi:hypothetical protein
LGLGDALAGFEISFQEMTFAFQSARHIDGVCAPFNRPQQVDGVHPTAARNLNNLDIGRIVQPHGTGKVPCGIGAVFAAEGDNLGIEYCWHVGLLSKILGESARPGHLHPAWLAFAPLVSDFRKKGIGFGN